MVCAAHKKVSRQLLCPFRPLLAPLPARHTTSVGLTTQAGMAWRFGSRTGQCTTPCHTRLPGTDELPGLPTRADKSTPAVHVCARLRTDPSCSLSHLLRRLRTQPPRQKAAPDRKQSHLCIRYRVPMHRAGVGTRVGERTATAMKDCSRLG